MLTQNSENNLEVLIVGAGPSGLMMASQLAIRGIRFRIIEKKEQPVTYSGALIVHARSMEVFEQMDIADKFLQEAIVANNLSIVFNGKKTAQISLREIGRGLTKFPNMYLIEQSKTEQLLIDFLNTHGNSVERKTELKSITQHESGVTSVLIRPDGKEETIKSNYLIATDGGHSIIREQLKIPFVGKSHPVSLFIIDCKAGLDLPQDEMCFSFSDESTSGFFPMKHGRKRIDGVIPKEMEGSDKITFGDIEQNFAIRLKTQIKLYDAEWFSVTQPQQHYALSYQQNNCFLVGDAAHTFTPVGAQGMNTGLQDAYNLAWKLALVIQQKAAYSLLNTYDAERKNIAKKLVRTTGSIYNLVTSGNYFTKLIRLYLLPNMLKLILPIIEKQKFFRQFCFSALSEIGINYRESPLSCNASVGSFPSSAPRPGDRLHYFVYKHNNQEINIQEKIKGTCFTLLIFDNDSFSKKILSHLERFKSIIDFEIIPLIPETKIVFDHFGITHSGFYLIRPDKYIAYRSISFDSTHFQKYLQQFLIAPNK